MSDELGREKELLSERRGLVAGGEGQMPRRRGEEGGQGQARSDGGSGRMDGWMRGVKGREGEREREREKKDEKKNQIKESIKDELSRCAWLERYRPPIGRPRLHRRMSCRHPPSLPLVHSLHPVPLPVCRPSPLAPLLLSLTLSHSLPPLLLWLTSSCLCLALKQ
jgi:hypothetical protein